MVYQTRKCQTERGILPHTLNIMYQFKKKCNLPHFLIYQVKLAYLLAYLNFIRIVCLSCFTFDENQTKNIPLEMTIKESVYYTIFSEYSLLQYNVSVAYTKFLNMDMTIDLK